MVHVPQSILRLLCGGCTFIAGSDCQHWTGCARNNLGDFVAQVGGPRLFSTYVHDDKVRPDFVSHLKNTCRRVLRNLNSQYGLHEKVAGAFRQEVSENPAVLSELGGIAKIGEPCLSCDIYHTCGGRCLFVNRSQEMLRE